MENKNVLYVLLATLIFSNMAYAKRFIVKNPKTVPTMGQIVKKFEFGRDQFYVVEDGYEGAVAGLASIQFARNISATTQADAVTEEAQIELVASSKVESSAPDGWHVKSLKYDEIPASINGQGIVVAIIDTGVNYKHPSLSKNMWINTNEIPNNKIDDDNNGFVDDVNGYNFLEKNGNPMDKVGHGSHCSGIVVAKTHPASESRGVARGAKIMAVKLLGEKPNVLTSAVEAIKYAVDNGAHILSNSWRIYGRWKNRFDIDDANIALLKSAIEYARSKNVIFVAAAGNEAANINDIFKSDSIYPIGYTGVDLMVGVASSDVNNLMSDFSNFGLPYVHVAAPGSDIYSTVLKNQWESYSGTSMATPLVAGVLALGLSKGYQPLMAIQKLKDSSTPNSGFHEVEAKGIINLVEFLK